jgi:hypothetical protein
VLLFKTFNTIFLKENVTRVKPNMIPSSIFKPVVNFPKTQNKMRVLRGGFLGIWDIVA